MTIGVDERFLRSLAKKDEALFKRLAKLVKQLEGIQTIPFCSLISAGVRGLVVDEVPEIMVSLPNQQGLRNLLSFVAQGKTLEIFATGCPDYGTKNGRYTFENLGVGVSVLPRIHLAVAFELASILWQASVDFNYHILIADLAEGTDLVVVNKFCEGNINEFLRRCQCTAEHLEALAKNNLPLHLRPYFKIGTFSSHYGDRYVQIQQKFLDLVLAREENDAAFSQAFLATHVKRIDLYRRFLAGFNNDPTPNELKYRTARGIAQYLAHFSLIRLENIAPVIVNHRTINLQWIDRLDLCRNDEERRSLSQKPQTPLFVIENKVY